MNPILEYLNTQKMTYKLLDDDDSFKTTYTTTNHCLITVYPTQQEQVNGFIELLCLHKLTYSVVSTGLNWGYGGKVPNVNVDILLNLCKMKKISIDQENKTATIEPGVTQQALFDYILQHNLAVMNPITGASVHSSIVGNALTGGYSNGIKNLRFERILSVKGVWNNGDSFNTFGAQNTKYSDQSFDLGKLKGGKNGVVTAMKIELDSLPNNFTILFFSTDKTTDFIKLTNKLIELKNQNLILSNWCFFNCYRILAETITKHPNLQSANKTLDKKYVLDLLVNYCSNRWNKDYNGLVCLYTPSAGVAKAQADYIHQSIFPYCENLNEIQLNKEEIIELRATGNTKKLANEDCLTIGRIKTFLGIPSCGSIPMSYWRKEEKAAQPMDIEKDKCGFVWLAVSVNTNGSLIQNCIAIFEKHCFNYGIEPFYVVDGVQKHEVYLMFALVFDMENREEEVRVSKIYELTKTDLENEGAYIYRKPVNFM